MKIKWLDRRIGYPGPYLTLCTTEKQYHKALKHCGIKDTGCWIKNDHSDATCHYLTNKKGQAVSIICVRVTSDKNAIEVAGLLIHEAVHVWQDYCKRIGEYNPGVEIEAYGIQAISQELLQAYSESIK